MLRYHLLSDLINRSSVQLLLGQCRGLKDTSFVPRVGDRRRANFRVRDYGYSFNFQDRRDPLPRIKNCTTPVAGSEPVVEDPWLKENALFGQNDYIDLLGDGSIHPAQLLYHVPGWLRGFPGDRRAGELQRLIHYRNLYKKKMQMNTPKRYHDLMKQIKYLLTRHNYRKQDELNRERDLGLWTQEPEFYYKDKSKRSWEDIP